MSDLNDPANSETRPQISPDDALPPVSPPSAGFIIQLFVIPGIIVLVIVLVWLMFTWLAFMDSDPQAYIDQMKQNNANSWQQAYNLSEELRQNETYKTDAALASQIAAFLNELLDQPLPKPSPNRGKFTRDERSEEIQRRGFLCKTLGEFYVADDALPVLIRAATEHEDDDDLRIRLAALEAIALLAENVRNKNAGDLAKHEDLMRLLMTSSRNEDHKIALRAAMGLAAVGSDEAIGRLEEMIDEPHHVDVHYNVATGLARHGNTACVEMLQEMLDSSEPRGVEGETKQQAREYKRAVILSNAIKAVKLLAKQNPTADLSMLEEPVNRLTQADVERPIRSEAADTLQVLQQRR
jgi:hypothetical protein